MLTKNSLPTKKNQKRKRVVKVINFRFGFATSTQYLNQLRQGGITAQMLGTISAVQYPERSPSNCVAHLSYAMLFQRKFH